jgi:ubiquinone/menaquinone biosynthesis C-methylase UbiE
MAKQGGWLKKLVGAGTAIQEDLQAAGPAVAVAAVTDAPEIKTWPDDVAVTPAPHDEHSAIELDHSYAGMYRLHNTCHKGLVAEMAARRKELGVATMLEVAPGTGWNTKDFIDAGFSYWCLDVSENALRLLSRKFPMVRTINCEIDDAGFVADGAFPMIYCSAMLEHLNDHGSALRQMIRMTGNDLYVMFYEGLTAQGPDDFKHYPFDKPEWRAWYGKKFSAYQDRHDGFFIKKYARATIAAIVESTGAKCEFLDSTNRPYLGVETILHVMK